MACLQDSIAIVIAVSPLMVFLTEYLGRQRAASA